MTESRLNIVQGEYAVSDKHDVVIHTLLGSCVAVCINDPVKGVGGMNHYLLPGDEQGRRGAAQENYGVNLMELLINGLLKRGARRENMQAKVFGGARTMAGLSDIGKKNIEFARRFLSYENIPIIGENTGGLNGRRIQYWPTTGRARQMLIAAPDEVVSQVAPKTSAANSGELELF